MEANAQILPRSLRTWDVLWKDVLILIALVLHVMIDMTDEIQTYLCGPIGDIKIENAKNWRNWLMERLGEMEIKTLDPLRKYGDRLASVRSKLSNWKRFGNIDAIRLMVSQMIIPSDLEAVKKCDFVTLNLPAGDVELCGSYGEITLAFYFNKPVYIVTKRHLKPCNIPKWAIGCSTKIFRNWEDYLSYVKKNWVDEEEEKDA